MIQIILQWYCRGILQGASFALPLKFLSWRATVMTTNVGGLDRILRILVGLVLIAQSATGTVGAWGWIGVAILCWPALAQRSLFDHVRAVGERIDARDLPRARAAVGMIVGVRAGRLSGFATESAEHEG